MRVNRVGRTKKAVKVVAFTAFWSKFSLKEGRVDVTGVFGYGLLVHDAVEKGRRIVVEEDVEVKLAGAGFLRGATLFGLIDEEGIGFMAAASVSRRMRA